MLATSLRATVVVADIRQVTNRDLVGVGARRTVCSLAVRLARDFRTATSTTETPKDPRNSLFEEFIRLAQVR